MIAQDMRYIFCETKDEALVASKDIRMMNQLYKMCDICCDKLLYSLLFDFR